METFKWCVRVGMQIDNQPTVNVVKFGDGYEQRQATGINSLLRSYPVVIKAKRGEEHREIDAFFVRHNAVTPFLFNDPYTGQQKKVVCENWKATMNVSTVEFSCTFREVVA